MADLDALYAEWKALDEARQAKKAAFPVLETARKAQDGDAGASLGSLPRFIETAPRASQEVLGPVRCRCNTQAFPEGTFSSVRTGRDFVPKVTPSGVVFGWEQRTKYVHLACGSHTIEKSTSGHRRVDLYVDELADKLKHREKVIEAVKECVVRPEDREALDDLLQRWFQRSTKWAVARKHIERTTRGLKFQRGAKEGALRIFNRIPFRKTWMVEPKVG